MITSHSLLVCNLLNAIIPSTLSAIMLLQYCCFIPEDLLLFESFNFLSVPDVCKKVENWKLLSIIGKDWLSNSIFCICACRHYVDIGSGLLYTLLVLATLKCSNEWLMNISIYFCSGTYCENIWMKLTK